MNTRIGFVGAGGIAQAHLIRLASMKNVSVVAVCDKLPLNAERSAKTVGAKAYTDHTSMIDQEILDAVFVCLPPFEHGEAEIYAAKKGIHLFIEKPIGIALGICEEIGREIERSGITCSVGYNLRYLDITARANSLVQKNEVGLVLGYNLTDFPWGKPWWREAERSGGQIVEQTTHIIDLERYLFGEMHSVQCLSALQLMKDVENMNIDDVSSVNLEFENGMIGSIVSSCSLPRPLYKIEIEAICKDMVLKIEPYGPSPSLTLLRRHRAEHFLSRNDSFLQEDSAFVNAVRNHDTSDIRSSYSDALKSLQVSIAANESSRTGSKIYLG